MTDRTSSSMTDKENSTPKRKKVSSNDKDIDAKKISYEYDKCYKFHEAKIKRPEEELQYYPLYFLRAHSKNNDPADVQTQIWKCCFEPDSKDPSQSTSIVSTCGGTSVCFISVETGEVILKYSRNTKGSAGSENLYALAWTSIALDDLGLKKMNILATSGGKSTVILIHPEAGRCYQMFRTVLNKMNAVVCSLLFHPKKATWLFCGHDDGHIQLWDIGVPNLPDYDVTPVHVYKIPPVGGEVYNMVYSQSHDLLFSGCDKGLFAWKIKPEDIETWKRLEYFEFDFQIPPAEEAGVVVDSICLMRDNILVVKCALHGLIYLFNIGSVLNSATIDDQAIGHGNVALKADSLLQLKWSDTDNYYMNLGVDAKSCTLVCGDDKGTLWVYDLASYVNGDIKSPLTNGGPIDPLECDLKLDWPELDDAEVEKAGKVRLDAYDIVVDNCTVSSGGDYIVAVTSNNMVCIWKRGQGEES